MRRFYCIVTEHGDGAGFRKFLYLSIRRALLTSSVTFYAAVRSSPGPGSQAELVEHHMGRQPDL